AILFYDYFLTLGREVDYIWKKKLSFVSILFYCYRYAAILSWPAIFFVTRPPLSWASHSLVSSIAYVTFLFSAMRIYALCDSKKLVLFGMLVLGLITPVTTTVS
ncbi:hypothetical protein FOMPIDRAFT_1105482, partial [Fomitopsis schrenkii]